MKDISRLQRKDLIMSRHINCDEDCAKCGRYTTIGRTKDGQIEYDCLITGKTVVKGEKDKR